MIANLMERFAGLPGAGAVERLAWHEGTMADYKGLAEFHYLRHAPVTATRVLVVEDESEAIERRWETLAGRTATNGRGYTGRVVGVLVESLPALSCVLRDVALGGRYSGWRDRGAAARLLNQEVRCISRVVVHPQWRGLGLAVRLVKRAMATMTTPYLEALAAMGRVHPFFRLAGMREYRRWPHAKDQRLLDALACCGIQPWELASERRMDEHLNGGSLSRERQALLRQELGRWAGRWLSLEEQLASARDRLLCEPVYYIAAKEDFRSEMTNDEIRMTKE